MLLREATKQSGIPMQPTQVLAKDIVVVSLHQASAEEFRKQLAQAIGATWEKDSSGFRLVRPYALIKAQQAQERQIRLQEIEQRLASLRKRVETQPVFGDAEARTLASKVAAIFNRYNGHMGDAQGLNESIKLQPESPAGRLAIAIMRTLTPSQISDVMHGGRIVYSTQQTAMQRRLTANVKPLLQRYLDEQRRYAAALKKLPATESWARSWSPLLNRDEPSMPSQLLIATQRSPYNPALTVNVMLVDSEGKYIGRTQTLLDLSAANTPIDPLAKGKIPLSENSKRFAEAIGELQAGKTFVKDEQLLRLLENTERNDPLSLVAADGLLAIAKNRQLIAEMPDSGFFEPSFTAVTKDHELDLAKFSDWLTGVCDVEQSGDWMVVSPRLRISTREFRVDRTLLGQFFRTARRSDGPTIEQLAEFASKLPLNYGETVTPFLAFILYPSLNASISDRNYEMLRAYGRLGAQQRLLLTQGVQLKIGHLAPESISELNYLIYRADSPVSISVSGTPEAELRLGLDSEVTVALPEGIPANGLLSFSARAYDAVILDGAIAPVSSYRPLTAWSLAQTLISGETANTADPRARVVIDKYRFGNTKQINMELQLTERILVRADFHESHFSPTAQSVAYESLPASFREAVEKAMVDIRKSRENTGPRIPPTQSSAARPE